MRGQQAVRAPRSPLESPALSKGQICAPPREEGNEHRQSDDWNKNNKRINSKTWNYNVQLGKARRKEANLVVSNSLSLSRER